MQRLISQQESAASSDNEPARQKLSQLQTYTSQLCKDTSALLSQLSSVGGNTPSAKTQKIRLWNDFSVVLKSFQSIQYKEVDQSRAELRRVQAASHRSNLIELGSQLPPPPGSRAQEQQASQQRQQQQQLQQQQVQNSGYQQALMMDDETNLEMVREREAAVQALEKDILDVNDIFKKLATDVHNQAELVDSIEANVDSATIRVTEGAEQLGQARDYRDRARRKQLMLISFGIIGLALLIVIIYLSVKN